MPLWAVVLLCWSTGIVCFALGAWWRDTTLARAASAGNAFGACPECGGAPMQTARGTRCYECGATCEKEQ